VQAKTTLGLYKGIRARPNGVTEEWALCQLVTLARVGWKNKVTGSLIETDADAVVHFAFDSSEEVATVGDIVALREMEMSLFSRQGMKAKSYKIVRFFDPEFTTAII
jgi:hypothetical protein